MKQIPRDVATAAQRILNTPDGETLIGFLVKDYGLMERVFMTDLHGKLSPINAAVRDGERAVVGMLFKLKQAQTFDEIIDDKTK